MLVNNKVSYYKYTMTNATVQLSIWTKISLWLATLVDSVRQSQAPHSVSQLDIEFITDILGRCADVPTQAEVIGRALYYMQLHPNLTASEAMIVGSSALIADSVEP